MWKSRKQVQKWPYPAERNGRLQLCSLFFLALTSCTTTVSPDRAATLPDGLYQFSAPPAIKRQYADLSWGSAGWDIQLLGDGGGSFTLRPESGNGVSIQNDQMSYPGLKRSLQGSGTVQTDRTASGKLELWLGGGPIKRNHRKGDWTLRPATPQEAESWKRKQQLLEERKKRAREAGNNSKES